jgi:hypothetical protein
LSVYLWTSSRGIVDGVRDQELLLIGGDKSLNKALNQALKLEVAKVAVGTPVRLR